jgi:hypothetical protein
MPSQPLTAVLRGAERLLVTDVVFAECVFVLESFYEAPRAQVATAMRALLAMPRSAALRGGATRRGGGGQWEP